MNERDTILTFEEARAMIKTSKSQMRKLLAEKQIQGFRIGKYGWRIPEDSIKKYIANKMAEAMQ